jgi:hypothetical protein
LRLSTPLLRKAHRIEVVLLRDKSINRICWLLLFELLLILVHLSLILHLVVLA